MTASASTPRPGPNDLSHRYGTELSGPRPLLFDAARRGLGEGREAARRIRLAAPADRLGRQDVEDGLGSPGTPDSGETERLVALLVSGDLLTAPDEDAATFSRYRERLAGLVEAGIPRRPGGAGGPIEAAAFTRTPRAEALHEIHMALGAALDARRSYQATAWAMRMAGLAVPSEWALSLGAIGFGRVPQGCGVDPMRCPTSVSHGRYSSKVIRWTPAIQGRGCERFHASRGEREPSISASRSATRHPLPRACLVQTHLHEVHTDPVLTSSGFDRPSCSDDLGDGRTRHEKGRPQPLRLLLGFPVIAPDALRSLEGQRFMQKQGMSEFVCQIRSLPRSSMTVVQQDQPGAASMQEQRRESPRTRCLLQARHFSRVLVGEGREVAHLVIQMLRQRPGIERVGRADPQFPSYVFRIPFGFGLETARQRHPGFRNPL